MEAHLWVLLKMRQAVTIPLSCAVDQEGGLCLIPEKPNGKRVWRPCCINSDEPDEQFFMQPMQDTLSGWRRRIWRLKRHLSMLRDTCAIWGGGFWL